MAYLGPEPPAVVYETHQTTVEALPRYELWEGVNVAIKNVMALGRTITADNVLAEIDRMVNANDIRLPYSYDWSMSLNGNGGKAKIKKRLSAANRKKKVDFENAVMKRILEFSKSCDLSNVPHEPTPSAFRNKDAFVRQYVAYKVENIDEAIRKAYAGRIGGLRDYQRDMKREAEQRWRDVKGK